MKSLSNHLKWNACTRSLLPVRGKLVLVLFVLSSSAHSQLYMYANNWGAQNIHNKKIQSLHKISQNKTGIQRQRSISARAHSIWLQSESRIMHKSSTNYANVNYAKTHGQEEEAFSCRSLFRFSARCSPTCFSMWRGVSSGFLSDSASQCDRFCWQPLRRGDSLGDTRAMAWWNTQCRKHHSTGKLSQCNDGDDDVYTWATVLHINQNGPTQSSHHVQSYWHNQTLLPYKCIELLCSFPVTNVHVAPAN